VHGRSTTTDALVLIAGATSVELFATTDRFAKTFWMNSYGERSINLLEDPSLIQGELDRRLSVARDANPTKRQKEVLRRELARVQKSMDRLMTAYQEDLLSLDDLRRRMPELRKREQATQAELSSLSTGLADRAGYLRLAETLTSFLERLREAAKTLDVLERHRIVRLLEKEVLVADDAIVIRHSIPVTNGVPGAGGTASAPSGRPPAVGESYLLRKGSNWRPSNKHLVSEFELAAALCAVRLQEGRRDRSLVSQCPGWLCDPLGALPPSTCKIPAGAGQSDDDPVRAEATRAHLTTGLRTNACCQRNIQPARIKIKMGKATTRVA
jgi:hypothetical protein